MGNVVSTGSNRVHRSGAMNTFDQTTALCGGVMAHRLFKTDADANCRKCDDLFLAELNKPSVERVAEAFPAAQVTAEADLFERARSIGYTDASAARMSDCFTNWDMIGDPCPTHPNHSITHECEACEVIAITTNAGYTLAGWQAQEAARTAVAEKLHAAELTYWADEASAYKLHAQVSFDDKG